MPVLDDGRWEKYAQNLALGTMPDVDAHEQAGFSRNAGNASRLKRNERIQGRVEELKKAACERAIEATALSKEWVIDELRKTYSKAVDVNQISAAVGALKLLGAESGMFTERSANENNHNWVVGATMSDEDKAKTSDSWADKFTDAGKPKSNGVNGHS